MIVTETSTINNYNQIVIQIIPFNAYIALIPPVFEI